MVKNLAIAGVLCLAAQGWASAAVIGPQPYLSLSDSAFNGLAFSYFHVETFEDGLLNTPGVTGTQTAITNSGPLTDSVDGDDGAIDGSGQGGRSAYAGATILTFTFDAVSLGGVLPTHAGLVWTDVGAPNAGIDVFSFEAFDQDGISLGVIGPFTLGDGSVQGETAEDRFFGATNAGGISRISLSTPQSTDWEADHLQYGAASAIPEPATVFLLGAGLAGILVFKRRS